MEIGGHRRRAGVVALSVAALAWGCATKRDITRLEGRLAALEASARGTEAAISRVDSLARAQGDLLHSVRAEVRTGLDEIGARVGVLQEKIALPEGAGPAAPVPGGAAEMGPVAAPGEGKVEEGAILPPPGAGQEGDGGTGAPGWARPQADGRMLYDAAYLDLTRGEYDLAIAGFSRFLETSPTGELADNAQYWIGECYYARRDYGRAIEEFRKVIERYPQGNKVPAALFKVGKSYMEMGDRSRAARSFQEVIDRYPLSEEARLAREYLEDVR